MSDDSLFEKQAAALDKQNNFIIAGIAANTIQQERLIRADKERNNLLAQQQEWDRQKEREEADRRKRVLELRRSVLAFRDELADFRPNLDDQGEVDVFATRNKMANFGYRFARQVTANEPSLEEMSDLQEVAQLRQEMTRIETQLAKCDLSFLAAAKNVEQYFIWLQSAFAKIIEYFTGRSYVFAGETLGLTQQQVMKNREYADEAMQAAPSFRPFVLEKMARVRVSLDVLNAEKARAEQSSAKVATLISTALALIDEGNVKHYLFMDSRSAIAGVHDTLLPIAQEFAPDVSKLLNRLPDWCFSEKLIPAQNEAIEKDFQSQLARYSRVAELAKPALDAANRKAYEELRTILAQVETEWPCADFLDLPELTAARKAYAESWTGLKDIFKSIFGSTSKVPAKPSLAEPSKQMLSTVEPNPRIEHATPADAAQPVPLANPLVLDSRSGRRMHGAVKCAISLLVIWLTLAVIGAIGAIVEYAGTKTPTASPDVQVPLPPQSGARRDIPVIRTDVESGASIDQK